MEVKKKHHYVWQHYLKAWTNKDQIWCKRDNKIFKTSTSNIGQIRYFYEVKALTEDHIRLITAIINKSKSKEQRITHFKFLRDYHALYKLKKLMEDTTESPEKLNEAFRPYLANYEEEYHSLLEGNAISTLNAIKNGDTLFFIEGDERIDFAHFLGVQYMRTNRQQEAFRNDICKPQGIDAENAWPVIRHILALNIGWDIYSGPYKIVHLNNLTNTPFITGDQPIINSYAIGTDDSVDDLELYYPIGPDLAILVTKKEELKHVNSFDVNEEQVRFYNRGIVSMSHEQLYSNSKDVLKDIITQTEPREG